MIQGRSRKITIIVLAALTFLLLGLAVIIALRLQTPDVSVAECGPSEIFCGGCINGCKPNTKTCNAWIDEQCGGNNCQGNGQTCGSGCCAGLTCCPNGRCGSGCGTQCAPEGQACGGVSCCSGLSCQGGVCRGQTQPSSSACTPCTSYTYSGWSGCLTNGTQTRTITGRNPSSCTVNCAGSATPILSRACSGVSSGTPVSAPPGGVGAGGACGSPSECSANAPSCCQVSCGGVNQGGRCWDGCGQNFNQWAQTNICSSGAGAKCADPYGDYSDTWCDPACGGTQGRVCTANGTWSTCLNADACGAVGNVPNNGHCTYNSTCTSNCCSLDGTSCGAGGQDGTCIANPNTTVQTCTNYAGRYPGNFLGCGDVVAGGNGNKCNNCFLARTGNTGACTVFCDTSSVLSCATNVACNTQVASQPASSSSGVVSSSSGVASSSSSSSSGSTSSGTTSAPVAYSCINMTRSPGGNPVTPGQILTVVVNETSATRSTSSCVYLTNPDGSQLAQSGTPTNITDGPNSTHTNTYTVTVPVSATEGNNYGIVYSQTCNFASQAGGACVQSLNLDTDAPQQPSISVIKSGSTVCQTEGGATIDYTVTVTNSGSVAGTVNSVVDQLPSQVTSASQVSNTVPTASSITADTITWTGPFTVNAGASITFTYRVTFAQADLNTFTTNQLTNTVTVTYGTENSTATFTLLTVMSCLPATGLFDEPAGLILVGLVLILAGILVNRSGLLLNLFGANVRSSDATSKIMESLLNTGEVQDDRFSRGVMQEQEKKYAKRKRR